MARTSPKPSPPTCRESTSGQADSRVRTFLYLAGNEGLQASEALSFLKSLDSSKARLPRIDPNGLSLKMLKICSLLIEDGTLRPFSIRWPKSAIIKRLHFLLREDLLKLDAITAETRLIVGHRIDTAEQLFCYRDEVNGKIEVLTADRKQLYKLQRTAAVKSDLEKAAEVKAQIDALSKELAALRKEVVLCNSIAERSGVIQEKIKAVRENEQPERKEKTDHVQFR